MEQFLKIQKQLEKNNVDAWILVDYENKNKTVVSFLGSKMLTRKIVLVFPKEGRPYIVCHSIDTVFLNSPEITKDFDLKVYHRWQEMLQIEKESLKTIKKSTWISRKTAYCQELLWRITALLNSLNP